MGIQRFRHHSRHESQGQDMTRDIEWNKDIPNLGSSGQKSLVQVGENVDAGETCYLANDGKFWLSDADAGATMPVKVLAVEDILVDAWGIVMHEGYYRNDDLYDWTPGNGEANLLFAHTTPGEMVQLANQPAGAGDQVQVVGWIVDANKIYFDPSLELVQIA